LFVLTVSFADRNSWGGIAGVKDGEYHCFRGCFKIRELIPRHSISLTPEVAKYAQTQMIKDLKLQHLTHGETQYRDIEPRILVEQQLNMEEVMDVTYWYIANGRPVLVSMECPPEPGTDQALRKKRTIRSPSFGQLPGLKLHSQPCDGGGSGIQKPKMWDLMRKVAEEVAPHLGPRVTRVDLYASDTQVFFSGTYRKIQTTNLCSTDLRSH